MASKQDPRIYVDIQRVDEEERMAYGYATTETKDSYGTIIDLERVKEILPDYMRFANIREMHQPSAVGTAESATVDEAGLYLAVKVVDDTAWNKVVSRVYKGFSIGGKKDYQIDDRIFLKSISEISLVDRPSNGDCLVDEFRVYGEEEEPMKKTVEEPAAAAGDESATGEERIETATITRDMYDVQSLGGILSQLASLCNWSQNEATYEGDNSPVPAKLRGALVALAEAYKEMAQEEIDELLAVVAANVPVAPVIIEMAAGAEDDVTRAGKRNSAKDAEDLQSIHDACTRLGASCGEVEKADRPDLTRMTGLEEDITRLEGELDTLRTEADTLRSENAKLKEEPAPAKGVTRVIDKGDELAINTADTTRTEQEETTDPQEMIKRIHQEGGTTITRL